MSNPLPSMRTLPTLSQAGDRIAELRGRLVPVDGQPTRFSVPRALAATTAERRALSDVAKRVETELKPCRDRSHVSMAVARILLGFEQGRGRGEVENALLVNEYVEALEGLPLAVIHAAADRFRNRTTLLRWDPAWRPSPAQFADEARQGLIPLRAQLVHIRQILAAEVVEPPSETDRAKVAAIAANWRDTRAATDAEREQARPAPEEVAQAREAHLHHLGAQLRDAADGATLGRLMGRLEAKAPRQGAEVA